MEMRDWKTTRQYFIEAAERAFRIKGTTAKELFESDKKIKGALPRRDKIMLGMWAYMSGDLEAENEYREVVKHGAIEIIIPLEIGEQGFLSFECPCQMEYEGKAGDRNVEIELSLYEHNVWTCPRCQKVYALRNMAAHDDGEEIL